MVSSTPLVTVHTVILYQAACHDCDWSGDLWGDIQSADIEADRHECETER